MQWSAWESQRSILYSTNKFGRSVESNNSHVPYVSVVRGESGWMVAINNKRSVSGARWVDLGCEAESFGIFFLCPSGLGFFKPAPFLPGGLRLSKYILEQKATPQCTASFFMAAFVGHVCNDRWQGYIHLWLLKTLWRISGWVGANRCLERTIPEEAPLFCLCSGGGAVALWPQWATLYFSSFSCVGAENGRSWPLGSINYNLLVVWPGARFQIL